VKQSAFRTAETTSMVMISGRPDVHGRGLLLDGTPSSQLLLGLGLPSWVFVVGILVVCFVLGWPLEWVPIVVVIVPVFLPILIGLQTNMIWFAILLAVTLQTCWLSPPVALSAYYLKGVEPSWELLQIYRGMMPFMGLQVLGVAVVYFFPQIVLWPPHSVNPLTGHPAEAQDYGRMGMSKKIAFLFLSTDSVVIRSHVTRLRQTLFYRLRLGGESFYI
jgi:TRAP-type mannitol/chloroaromatic compound transport system permease large subunit